MRTKTRHRIQRQNCKESLENEATPLPQTGSELTTLQLRLFS